jgi:hypothetical protein
MTVRTFGDLNGSVPILGVQGLSPTGISNNKGSSIVQSVQHSDKSLSLTAKQTFGIPQQVVCPGSVPNRGAGANPSPNPRLWGLSPTGIFGASGAPIIPYPTGRFF